MEDLTKQTETPVIEEAPKQTAKQRVLEAQGKEVPLDLFLFSCLEHERILKVKAGSGAPIIRWPVLGSESSNAPTEDLSAASLDSLVTRLFAWYQEEIPALSDRHILDHERLMEVIPGVVALNQDLDKIYRGNTNTSAPGFDGPTGNHKFWDDVVAAVKKNFSTYENYIVRYIAWSHGVEKVETFAPGSRPPVGRYAPPPLRLGGDRDRGRGGPRSGGDRGGPRSGGGGGDRPPRPANFGGEGGDRAPREDRPPREDRGPRPDRAPREDRGPRPDRGPRRGNGGNDDQTAKLTDAAMAEVDQALASLRDNPSMGEVVLKPTNSFYRRIQHQKIVDAGFNSASVGEGPDRAVKVARKDD